MKTVLEAAAKDNCRGNVFRGKKGKCSWFIDTIVQNLCFAQNGVCYPDKAVAICSINVFNDSIVSHFVLKCRQKQILLNRVLAKQRPRESNTAKRQKRKRKTPKSQISLLIITSFPRPFFTTFHLYYKLSSM